MDLMKTAKLTFRRKVLVLAGAKIDITSTDSGSPVGFIKMKALKLKEDVRIFTDSNMTNELLRIHARQIIDFGATYDVFEPSTEQPLFSLRRKGLRSSFVRDKWLILDTSENEIGSIVETGLYAILRRYIAMIPYIGDLIDLAFFFMKIDYEVSTIVQGQEQQAAVITRQKNPFVITYASDATQGTADIDNRMLVAACAMLSAIEIGKN